MVFSKRNNVFFVLCLAVVAFAGCDLLPTNSKAVKKAEVAPVAAPIAPVAQKIVEDKDAPLPAGVLAKVGEWSISLEEFNQKIAAVKKQVADFNDKDVESKKMILEELVRQQLLVQDAREQKLDQKKEIVEATKEFQSGLLVQEYVNNLTIDMKADEAEAKAYYEAHPNEFVAPMEKQIREIVVPTETEAKDILVQVLQGADFAQIAKERSKGKSAANGGDLGFLKEAPFQQMFAAVQGLNKGAVSAVFQGPEGYYLAKVEDTKGGDKVAFADIKEDLIKGLTLQKQQKAVADKITEIRKRIGSKTNPDLLGKSAPTEGAPKGL